MSWDIEIKRVEEAMLVQISGVKDSVDEANGKIESLEAEIASLKEYIRSVSDAVESSGEGK